MTDGTLHQFYCERCERYVAADAVVTISAADGRVRIPGCPTCRGHVRREEQQLQRPFEKVVLADAIGPIFHARNVPILLATTFAGFFLSRFVPILGLLVACGILLAYAAEVTRSASDPRHEGSLGGPADFRDIGDLVDPVVRRGVVLAVGVAPLCIVHYASDDPVVLALGTLAGGAVFVFYTPAALIVAARAKSILDVLSPIAPIRVAWRMGGDYLLGVAMHLVSTLVGGVLVVGAFALAGVLDRYVAIFPFALAWAVLVVVTTAQARILGLLVREHRHVLGIDG